MTTTPDAVDHASRAHAEFGPSSLKSVAACAGYHGKDGTNAAAEMGTRIHEAAEIRDPSTLLTDEEVTIYQNLVDEEDTIFSSLYGGTEDVTIEREKKLVLELDCKSPTFGTSDLVAHKGSIGLQIDYKTGISKIDPPRENWQAKAYVLAAFQMMPQLERIHFAFIIPKRGEVLTGYFDREEMDTLRAEISAVISRAEGVRPLWETASVTAEDVTPNSHCRFCRHVERCPALTALAVDTARRLKPEMMLLPDGEIHASEVEDPEVIEQLFVVAKILETWASSIKFKATTMAHAGVEFETLKLKSMGALKKVREKNYLAQLAVRHGLDIPEIIAASDLSLNQLSQALHAKAPKGQKSSAVKCFENEAIELDLVEVGPTRYALTSR